MSERIEIIELVDSIFDTVDAKDWVPGITFRAWHTRGDDSIRAHTLSS